MKCGLCSFKRQGTQSGNDWVSIDLKTTKFICPFCVYKFQRVLEDALYKKAKSVVVMVTGGRDYKNTLRVHKELDTLHCIGDGIKKLIVGDSRGLDRIATQWALDRCVPCEVYVANWDKFGNSAGPIRNSKMLKKGKPDVCLSFPSGRGMKHAAEKAERLGVKVYYVL